METASAHGRDRDLHVLLIEDDPGDATLVRDMLEMAEPSLQLTWVQSIREALPLLDGNPRCVLLDLQLPDAVDFSGLDAVLEAAPRASVVVLTGFADQARGVEAVARGAQDYLAKAQVDPDLLARTIRYALQRRTAADTARELADSRARANENARLERGLLPRAITRDEALGVTVRYRPGRDRALLGGDFYDVVQCPDGTIYALIGDVCGHGPDEAALGVCLRVAWRTLVLAGTEEKAILPLLDQVHCHERDESQVFATVAMVRIANDSASARIYLAGHPAPIVFGLGPLNMSAGPPLGILDGFSWAPEEIALPPGWELALFTDGIFEGMVEPGSSTRLGLEGMSALMVEMRAKHGDPTEWVDAVIERVLACNGGPLSDDLAVVVLTPDAERR
ncbi:MAG: PP2C family protein-serine/threonine phosphatase [Sporichthyaceae bacterium]